MRTLPAAVALAADDKWRLDLHTLRSVLICPTRLESECLSTDVARGSREGEEGGDTAGYGEVESATI
jgi:hypothetical protein